MPFVVPHTVPMVRTQPKYLKVEITNGEGFDGFEYDMEMFDITIRPHSYARTHADVVKGGMQFETTENGENGTKKKLSLVMQASLFGLQSGQTIEIYKVDIHQFQFAKPKTFMCINNAIVTASLARGAFEREALQYWSDVLDSVNY